MSQVEQTRSLSLDTAPVAGLRTARVNLLPPEIEQARRLRHTQAGLAAGLAAVALVAGGVYALQVHQTNQAADDLAATKAQTTKLQDEQAQYADVPRTIAAIDAAETARSTAMAKDVEWFRTLNNFALTLPTNVWFTGLTLSVSGAAPTAATASATPTAGAATGPVGIVTVQGTAFDHPDVATWLDVLARQPGMADAYFSSSARAKIGKKNVVTFTSTADITADALSHRYDRKQG
jgi:Tfp pilus assembly protein PilN